MPLGPMEIILIIVVIALIFGAKKLPELGKGVGQGIREFKKEVKDTKEVTDIPSQRLDPVIDPVAGKPFQHEPAVQNPNEHHPNERRP